MPHWTPLHRAGSAFRQPGAGRSERDRGGGRNGIAGVRAAGARKVQAPVPQGVHPAAMSSPGRHAGPPAEEAEGPGRAGGGSASPEGGPGLRGTAGRTLLGEVIRPEALAAAEAVVTPGGRAVLPGRRADRAAAELAALDEAARARVSAHLQGASDVLAAYLLLTLATGRGAGLVDALAEAVAAHARDAGWLHRHLGVVLGGPGPATYEDDTGARLRLRQLSPATAAPAAMIVLRVLVDPTYGYWLTSGTHLEPGEEPDHLPFEQRFRSQQTRVQAAIARRHQSRTPLPRLLGSSPTASARFLNRFTRLTGARFEWRPVDGGDPARVHEALATLAAGLDLGVAVPMFVGGHADRHVVLAFARPAGAVRLYDPSRGEVLDIAEDDIVAGRPVAGGWDRLEGLLAAEDV